jgi:hypothetical protein
LFKIREGYGRWPEALVWPSHHATEDIKKGIIDTGGLESYKEAEKFTKFCDLNDSLTAEDMGLEAAKPVQGPHKKFTAAHHEIEELEEELHIESVALPSWRGGWRYASRNH